jgi:C-terminal processing protease CtpA/Prc
MTRLAAVALFVLAFVAQASTFALADIPPPYDPYGIGARLSEAKPFPRLADVQAGSPAAKAGLKNGDGVIAIDGEYSAAGRVPFYFFARGMQGRQNSAVVLVILRDEQRVFTVKVARTVPLRSNW